MTIDRDRMRVGPKGVMVPRPWGLGRTTRHGLRMVAGFSLMLAALTLAACRQSDEKPGAPDQKTHKIAPWFVEITAEVGLDFVHQTGADGGLHLQEVMSSGCALFDYDNDGDLDIYLTNGAFDLGKTQNANGPANQLYRQEADGRFVNVTNESGLGDRGYGMGVAIGDIDNDGDADVYVTNYGPDHLYRNRGDGTFEDITTAAGIAVDGWSASAGFVDYDRDGFLDLYVTRYLKYRPNNECFDLTGRRTYCGPKPFRPVPDVLLHNNGDGTFTDVTEQAGLSQVFGHGLGVVFHDFNADGWLDIYVANDGDANQLWINQQDGTFRDEALFQGVALNWHGVGEAGMGVVLADFDNDLDFDLFMTHLRAESNTLYRNEGVGRGFTDATATCGLGPSSVAYTGFGTAAFDADLDGDLDLMVANGRVAYGDLLEGVEIPPPWDILAEPNLFYLNDGTGSFELIAEPVASLCGRVEISRALAAGDIDNDGDIDLLLTNGQGRARLFRNDVPRRGNWLTIRALDPTLGRDAIGARVTVHCGARRFVRTIGRCFSYLSSNDPRAHFGLGQVERVDRINVVWPDGTSEDFSGVAVDREVKLVRGKGERPG